MQENLLRCISILQQLDHPEAKAALEELRLYREYMVKKTKRDFSEYAKQNMMHTEKIIALLSR